MYKSTGPDSMSKQPWLRDGYRFSSTFLDRGMEIAIPSGRPSPFSTPEKVPNMKELPAIPIRTWKRAPPSSCLRKTASSSRIQPIITSISFNDDLKPPSPSPSVLSSKVYSVPASDLPHTQGIPKEGLAQNLQKLKKNVHDLVSDTLEDRKLSRISTESSGSDYSQPEWIPGQSTGTFNVRTGYPNARQDFLEPQTSLWSETKEGVSSKTLIRSSARAKRDSKNSKFPEKPDMKNRKSVNAESSQEHNHYTRDSDNDITNGYKHNKIVKDGMLIPRPSGTRNTRPQPIIVNSRKEPNFLKSIRHSFSWGVEELLSPNKKQHFTTPVTGTFAPGTPHHTASKPRSSSLNLRRFGSGKHPLKSPFPFNSTREVSTVTPMDQSENSLKRSLSGAMRKLSQRRSPNRKNVIDTTFAATESAATPISTKLMGLLAFSPKETLQRGNEHIHYAVTKARLRVHIKTTKEKRRESLMKKIVIVGIRDQSSGGRVSEWL